ncbi:hypothetical protein CONPUDRAFT_65908 [Coniophora puteana RWD-64-598 SS2]|uniref:HIG1 domain-containing protein n=1 Tax=Coniophora puteana (strain RWD-64-598) TaxID=741705 RepID=A0A5M3M985_CONPW|nr:uncharacterized protein CONPUDRAFT_65908 [Coniophora puteana RWD-64-598 SS2]EIW75663.1 hypothetical protein CONPUDRAFT_65908 [Coniophora puteana RWD-64-598 SS2]
MKLASEEELAAHSTATIRGAMEGTAVSAAVAVPSFMLLNRRWAYYRSLPLSLKALGGILIVAPCLAIQAERRGLEFDRERYWVGAGKNEMDREAAEEQARWESLTTGDKVSDWATRHQYSIILGSWALSLGIAGGIVARNKYQTIPQKVVQARMWAQGLTIGVLVAAGILTHRKRQETAMRKLPVDHSWQTLVCHYPRPFPPFILTHYLQLEEQAREEEERQSRLAALRSAAQPLPSSTSA